MAHVQKARTLLKVPTDWISAAILNISDGISDARARQFRYPNVARRSDLVLTTRYPRYGGVRPSRIHVLHFPAPGAYRDPLSPRPPARPTPYGQISQKNKKKNGYGALAGSGTYANTSPIGAKLAFRRHIRIGCIPKRPCAGIGRARSATRSWRPPRAIFHNIERSGGQGGSPTPRPREKTLTESPSKPRR